MLKMKEALQDRPFRSPQSVLRASSVALVGASERGKWPKQIYANLREQGYPGPVYLINPRQQEVFGERCFASLRDLPAKVDHAIIIVPAAAVPNVLEEAEQAGLASATVYAAGLGDGDDAGSKERGVWLRDFVAKSHMRIAGPNCMGAHSYRERLFAYPNGELSKLPPGPLACIFQSGGTLQFWMKSAADRGIRFSYGISSGNETDLDLADYLNFVVDDPETRQIVLFIEGIRRPGAFMQAAARALAAGKPIIAIKTGATMRSRMAAQSHTGAIAGDYAAYVAMCERYGIVNCRNLEDLLETALAFQCNRLPRGPRIGFVTTSGGTVDLLYDYAEAEGAVMPAFAERTVETLGPHMQEGITPKNPLDLGIPSTLAAAADVCEIVLRDANVDMLAWAGQLPRKKGAWPDVTPLQRLLTTTDKPVLAFGRMVYQVTPDSIELQNAVGFPFLQGLEPTLRALNALSFYGQRQGRAPAALPPPKASQLSLQTLDATLAEYGIALPQSRTVSSAAEAVSAAETIGFPVALKIRSPDILHKTEAGGVVLGLTTGAMVQQAVENLLASAKATYPDAQIEGFLVQEMVQGVEVILGARDDELYGPMLLAGAGGVLVELVKDAALRLLPVSDTDVRTMIDSLKMKQLLAGFRGRPPADRAALEAAALALGRFFVDHRDRIADIEVNPLMVRASSRGAVAVDVRVLWRDEAGRTA
jgi:acetate---CoA ligase (ADP-forming)